MSPILSDLDVVVVGSGAGGMIAALRAHDRGLRVAVFEKSQYYGGTSAVSGGQFWVPNNHHMKKQDSPELAADYIRTVTRGEVDEGRLTAFLRESPLMARYLEEIGMILEPVDWHPDYTPEAEGGIGGRSLVPANLDAAVLGDEIDLLRQPLALWKIFNRYSMDTSELGLFALRLPGWKRTLVRLAWRYWSDIGWRRKRRRDRRLTMGGALIGGLRRAMLERDIPLYLNCRLASLTRGDDEATSGEFERNGQRLFVTALRGVILAAGGFEHSQRLRDQYHQVPTRVSASLTPGDNDGGAMEAAQALGADVEFMQHAWWTPTSQLPLADLPNKVGAHATFRSPHSICVNGEGRRFADEACSYDRFGLAMIEDHQRTGKSIPCWMVFDSQFRQKYACGGLMPTAIMPDRMIPRDWWDTYIYRADTIAALAEKMNVDVPTLVDEVARSNAFAASGEDRDFGRGDTDYDRILSGDPRIQPSPCLAPIDRPPFYAIRLDLGDIGTKGGLKVDANARVLDEKQSIIPGLYATGNIAGALFASAYPGPGATLGTAMTFGFVAANAIADAQYSPRNAQPLMAPNLQ